MSKVSLSNPTSKVSLYAYGSSHEQIQRNLRLRADVLFAVPQNERNTDGGAASVTWPFPVPVTVRLGGDDSSLLGVHTFPGLMSRRRRPGSLGAAAFR